MTPDGLRERRTALGLTRQQLADLLGVTRVTVWRWETGAVDISGFGWLDLALEALERRPRQDDANSYGFVVTYTAGEQLAAGDYIYLSPLTGKFIRCPQSQKHWATADRDYDPGDLVTIPVKRVT